MGHTVVPTKLAIPCFYWILALWFLTGMFRQQLHCPRWGRAARFAKQIDLPPYLVVYHGNSQ